jgi:hypothetical protein
MHSVLTAMATWEPCRPPRKAGSRFRPVFDHAVPFPDSLLFRESPNGPQLLRCEVACTVHSTTFIAFGHNKQTAWISFGTI